MKTHVLRLETFDDVYSARDKMAWNRSEQILVVIPPDNDHLTRKLDLILLNRLAKGQGAKLGIYSLDPQIQFHAGQIGIPVFTNLLTAQTRLWRTSKKRIYLQSSSRSKRTLEHIKQEAKTSHTIRAEMSWLRIALFGLGVLAVITLGLVLLPHAVILLPVEQRIQTMDISLVVDPGAIGNSLPGSLPCSKFEKVIDITGTALSTGTTRLSTGFAKGEVQFSNVTDKVITIPAGSVILSSANPDVAFQTQETGVALPGAASLTSIPVVAIKPGPESNVGAHELIILQGAQKSDVLVTNNEMAHGGYEQVVPSPSDKDYLDLQASLEAQASDLAFVEFTGEISPGMVLLKDTLTINRIVEAEIPNTNNIAADQLKATLSFETSILVCEKNDIYTAAQNYLNANLPVGWVVKGNSLFVDDANTFSEKEVSPGVYQLNFRAAQILVPEVDQFSLVNSILGKTTKSAMHTMSASTYLKGEPIIKMSPSFWPWVPFLAVNVELRNQ